MFFEIILKLNYNFLQFPTTSIRIVASTVHLYHGLKTTNLIYFNVENIFSGDINENDVTIITATTETPEPMQDEVQTQHDNPVTVNFHIQ